jgi:hypothetical protein
MKFAIIVTADLPGPRSRIWGSEYENLTFGSGVPNRPPIRLEDGWVWGPGIVSDNAPQPFRAWSIPLACIRPFGRGQLKLLLGAGLARVYINEIEEDDLVAVDTRENWRVRANWVRPPSGVEAVKQVRVNPRMLARAQKRKR